MNSKYALITTTLLVGLAAILISEALNRLPLNQRKPRTLLEHLCKDQFAWSSSTTPIPISTVSVLAKALLSHDTASLPAELLSQVPGNDTLPLQPVRRFTNAQRLRRVKNFCRTNACDPNERDPLFSITPLHLAAITGDAPLEQWLLERGAVPTFDHANRKPQNLSFSAFISNSKAWKAQGEDCDFPIVDFSRDASHARKEVRRLVTEGEPVLMRAAYPAYENSTSAWEVHQWVTQFAHHKVTVGRVPYANAFNLATEVMTLQQYFNTFNASSNSDPSYVFNKDTAICQPGYDTLSRLVEEAFPIDKLLVHPNDTGGLDGIHFFFGSKHSGAPFHVHSDAINAAIKGRKKWFVYTPQRTIYSRRTIKRWLEEDYATMPDEEKPLECVQHPGDVVYVPLDWGHAVLNLDDHAFGFALELLNRRDTLSHIWR